MTDLLKQLESACKGPIPSDEYMNIVRPENILKLCHALRAAREAIIETHEAAGCGKETEGIHGCIECEALSKLDELLGKEGGE